ncbi:MAG: hypothetical protein KAH12_10405 [Anaerolineales bacterium]|nr:hypothetical protein [Anaerolineales bacterium]
MNKTWYKIGLILLLILLLGVFLPPGSQEKNSSQDTRDQVSSFYDSGCTVIYGVDEENVLGGNNEDFTDSETRIWFLPPEEGKFGRALVGYDSFIWQGGMNDQGLFFDAMSIEETVKVEQGNKPKYQGSLPAKALEACADVDCVLDLFARYHAYDTWVFQFMFGDASGNSVIIEPNQTNHGGRFLVGTNFLQSVVDENSCRYCDRYWTARSMFENSDSISVDLMRDILSATQLEGDYPTQYSTIYDLKENLIYLYLFHNFEEVRIFDLDEELAKGYHVLRMENLFDDTLGYYVFARTERGRQAEIRTDYYPVELDSEIYSAYLGDYLGPEDLEMAFDYYSVDYVNGDLVLKLIPDKAWMKLEPTSETEFFHLSFFDYFEITFLPEGDGEVNGFILSNAEGDYEFQKTSLQAQADEEETRSVTFWSVLWDKIWSFSRTNTFKFLAIILGLILLQFVLQYLKSLLV